MRRKINLTKWLHVLLTILLITPIASAYIPIQESSTPSEIIYVDDDATGANVGTSWEYAMNSLQDALLLAYFMEKPVEIRVAEGIYTPDHGIGIMPGDPSASFELMNGVTIKGGYASNLSRSRGRADVRERDINQYKSILSGDLNGDDELGSNNIKENSYHVLTASDIDETAVLDGFTITGSNSIYGLTSPYNHSGGMYNNNSSPTLIDCTFKGNDAWENGAGMYNNNSNPTLLNCTFTENIAPEGGSGMYNNKSRPTLFNCMFIRNNAGNGGAGMHNDNSNPILINCTFSGNHVNQYGGGMYNIQSAPALTNCIFIENSAGDGAGMYNLDSSTTLSDCLFNDNSSTRLGGAIHNRNSNPIFLNCIFNRNSSLERGGGMCNVVNSNPTLTNCTFTGNRATYGGAIDCYGSSPIIINNTIVNNIATEHGGGIYFGNTSFTITNTILWNNSPNELYEEISGRERISSLIIATYNNIKGGFLGEGNIDSDPLFADPDNGDYHLKSQAGRWDPNTGNWILDKVSSPCIDAGDPNTPVGLERFPNGGRINIGAYGGTPEASLSHWQLPGFPVHAYNPLPANGATDVPIDIILSWTPGKTARLFNVYLGIDFQTVYQANINNPLDVLVSQNQDPNTYSPGRLNAGQIYYWRIDEVDTDGTIITGTVWTFITYRPKGRACFTGRTPVWTDGALLPISKVAFGQSINIFENIGKVEKVQEHNGTFTCYDILLESGRIIIAAENHYFMTDSGQWLSLKNLKAGIRLKTSSDSIGIKSITKQPMPYVGKVYNLKIESSDRYMVGEDAVIVRDY